MAKKTVYDLITEQIIALLDKGEIPWRKPWKFATHMNGVSGYIYNGINPLVLDCVASLYGYTSNKWVTYNQMTENGGRLKTDTKQCATKVVYWNMIYEKDADGNKTDKVVFAKPIYHNMFNLDQIDWPEDVVFVDDPEVQNPDTEVDIDQVLFERMKDLEVKHGGGRAFYSPHKDYIGMPAPEQFECDDEYYCTLFHELTHATGHKSRIGRFNGSVDETAFGSQSYSKEELIAEFGAAFLCARNGVDDVRVLENSAAYIAGWKKRLADNPKWWSSAASQARKATEFIMGD